ncbi:tRNA uridine-5-carboxymethylaminomethyl(34) synthesis GTPase MnmE [Fretibacter rubidus]|uniref:tRNA uridine-5-carboxymethylaminomethyl(34) synthesis GTPase MnmE n=1 Tax=Fretibacter rubidus TaxID=570162 RepID=UPI00352A7A8D
MSNISSHQNSDGVDTIFALATAAGRAGVAVFRVSGPKAVDVACHMTDIEVPKPRHAAYRTFYSQHSEAIDDGLLIIMPGPASFTGENCVEFQTHGSPAVVEAMAKAIMQAGARQAEAGEFTRRAFQNGRMDLTEAEGLADLIDAESDAQRKQALRQMQGGLKTRYAGWKDAVLDALAQIEGEIDFPDEADIPDDLAHNADAPLTALIEDMDKALDNAAIGERVREGLTIAIVGAPNAGKSSVINRLAGRDAAIVTDQAGTTRDIIDVHMNIAGFAVRLSDTAGLRESGDAIEAEGIRRAVERAKESDIRILVHDSTEADFDPQSLDLLEDEDIVLFNKSDLNRPKSLSSFNNFDVSAITGQGFEVFQLALDDIVKRRFSPASEAGLTRARHRDCVSRARASLAAARKALKFAPELAGDDLRSALQALKELAGETDIEAVFDRIFSRFCVGK